MLDSILKRLFVLSAALILFPVLISADDDSDCPGARISAEVDYKIMKGLHVFASEEVRLKGKDIMDRSYTEIGASYKFSKHFKFELSYTAIAVYKSESTQVEENYMRVDYWYDWRHRVSADIVGTFKYGQWKFSLRERIQATHKMNEVNNYQQPQTSLVWRSRVKASYKFRSIPLEPYVYVEPRMLLNGAKWSDEATTDNYAEATFLGHEDVYVNRVRGAIGLEWQLNSRHSFDIYGLCDLYDDKEIDARREGSKKGIRLKMPIDWQSGVRASLGLGYKFSF